MLSTASGLVAAFAIEARAATEQYLATVPPALREPSDAYFEGGYWIRVWGAVLTVGLLWLLLHSGFSRRMRDAAGRVRRIYTAMQWKLAQQPARTPDWARASAPPPTH